MILLCLCDMVDNEEDRQKFERIYHCYRDVMYFVAYDIVKNEQDAEDIVEESLEKVIAVLDQIDEDENKHPKCKNLMITIARNTAIDYWRKQKRERLSADMDEELYTEKSAEELYIEAESYAELIKCINSLDKKYRDVLRLRKLYHLNAKETAKLLNISEYLVNTRYMRGKRMLAEKLKERGENE